jgi:DNA-binding response OmpR family regulator
VSNKIYVCDDDEGIIDVTKIVLEEQGYDVTVLSHGEDLVKKVMEDKPSVILIDLWMPDISGEKITLMFKKNPQTKDIRIIVFSASKDTEKVALDAGADDYICKPFDIADLESKVREQFKIANTS